MKTWPRKPYASDVGNMVEVVPLLAVGAREVRYQMETTPERGGRILTVRRNGTVVYQASA